MSSRFLFFVCAFISGISPTPSAANQCGALYIDAYGMHERPCGATQASQRLHWSGVTSIITRDDIWAEIETSPATTSELDILAGQKTLRAGAQNIMSIAMLVDKYGNPAPDQTETDFLATIGGTKLRGTYKSKNGIAFWLMENRTKATTGYMSAQTTALQSKRSDFDIISNDVTQIDISQPHNSEFSAKSQLALTAINIKDQFDNDKDDGALVRFQSTSLDGSKSFAQGIISNNTATAFPFNEATTPISEWTANIGAGKSEPVTLNTSVQELKPKTHISVEQNVRTNTMRVKAGPFKTLAGHRAIDGTPIQFFWQSLSSKNMTRFTTSGRMVDGSAEAVMPLPEGGATFAVDVLLLGKSFTATIPTGAKSITREMKPVFHAEMRGAMS